MASNATITYPVLVKVGRGLIEVGEFRLEVEVSPQGNIKAPTVHELRKALKKVRF